MKKLLITRPNYDDTTSYLFFYAGKIIEFAEQKNFTVKDLTRPNLTRANFTHYIDKQEPELVFFNAHGDDDIIYGDKIDNEEEILIKVGENHDLLSKKITYARACWVGDNLGKACTERGGCFIGYNIPFSFWIDTNWSANPHNDKTAKLFLGPSNSIVKFLIKGNIAKQAHEKSIEMFKKNILKVLKNKGEPGAMASVSALWNNMQGQVIYGDTDLRV